MDIAMAGGHRPTWYGIREADGKGEVRKAVGEQLKGGADVMEIMSSAGTACIGVNVCSLPNAVVVAEGYAADLILFDANLLEDLAKAFQNVRQVVKDGVVVMNSQ